jgi:hypothetical protein
MLRFKCASTAMPNPGDAIFSTEGEAGLVVSAASIPNGCEFLAVTQLNATDAPLFADPARRRPLQRLDLPYVLSNS